MVPSCSRGPWGFPGAGRCQRNTVGQGEDTAQQGQTWDCRALKLALRISCNRYQLGYWWEGNRKGSVIALFCLPMAEEGSVLACAVRTLAITSYYYSYFAFAKRWKSFRPLGGVLEQRHGAVGTGLRHWHVLLICCQFSWCWAAVALDLSPLSRAAKWQHVQAVCWAFLSLLWSRHIFPREPLLKPPAYFCTGDCA